MADISIRTDRLLLRPLRDDDLSFLISVNQDSKVMEFIGPVLDESESRAMIERARKSWMKNGYGRFAVEIADGSELIGFIGLAQCKFESHFTPAVEIGWRLAQKSWGCGYATEGANAVINWAFQALELMEIVSFTSELNFRSINVMKKIEMQRNPKDDFQHPNLAIGDPLKTNVLYRRSKK